MSAREEAVRLATIKVVKDVVAGAEKDTKAALALELDPGDRKSAVAPDGSEIGVVSFTHGRETWKVVDEPAFTRWVQENRPDEITPRVRESFVKALGTLIKATGVIPDGVELTVGDPYVTVRQTDTQKANALTAIQSGALSEVIQGMVQIEEGRDEEDKP